ncbi:Alcohol dehydrogenase-like 6 [Camellia lanceoleosa]|uniref:Alcohol dehydrogenase-like 6 n=1 Tax=Camellia lanceoleosa TaxID=1840588 RepID=A0ACC0H2I7_9ERIC|nr:Alcohol dehydrogenase-like 6 [Camellia lanceoleosa]
MKSKTEAAAAHGSSAAGDEAKLLSDTVPTLPPLAVKDLLSIGVCIRCIFRCKSNICQVLGLKRWGVMHSDQGTSFSVKGRPIYHYCAVSSFSEFTVVHSGCAIKFSSVAPLEKICLFSYGVAAGLGAAWKVTDIDGGSPMVIFRSWNCRPCCCLRCQTKGSISNSWHRY